MLIGSRSGRSSGWCLVALAVFMGGAVPAGASAQDRGTVVGLVAGGARTTQIWRPDADASSYTGVTIAGFADAVTSLAGLAVRAEGGYARRGGDVTLSVSGQPAVGRMRTDYLTVSVHAKLTRAFGPLQAHLAFGPTLDQVVASRLDPILAQVLEEEKPTVFAVTVAGGLGAWVSPSLFLGADVRLVEGLGDAYAGGFTEARNRSVEVRFVAGVPLEVIRPR